MADHTHRILRNWRKKVTSTSYSVLWTEAASTFFGAGTVVGSDKWVAYGMIEGVLARPSTGGDGQRLPFLLYKAPGAATPNLLVGTLQNTIGTSSQFIQVSMSGSNFQVEGRLHADNGMTGILSVTLDLHLVGGTGPVS